MCDVVTQDEDAMLCVAEKLTPVTLRKKKHLWYTPTFISAIREHLKLEQPLDMAVYACLTVTDAL